MKQIKTKLGTYIFDDENSQLNIKVIKKDGKEFFIDFEAVRKIFLYYKFSMDIKEMEAFVKNLDITNK